MHLVMERPTMIFSETLLSLFKKKTTISSITNETQIYNTNGVNTFYYSPNNFDEKHKFSSNIIVIYVNTLDHL